MSPLDDTFRMKLERFGHSLCLHMKMSASDLRAGVALWMSDYVAAGAPFGRSAAGLLLWLRFGTWTTVN